MLCYMTQQGVNHEREQVSQCLKEALQMLRDLTAAVFRFTTFTQTALKICWCTVETITQTQTLN